MKKQKLEFLKINMSHWTEKINGLCDIFNAVREKIIELKYRVEKISEDIYKGRFKLISNNNE